jgi:hypothetical protein
MIMERMIKMEIEWIAIDNPLPLNKLVGYDLIEDKRELTLQVGMLLKTDTHGIILVGDINRWGGVCDDCMEDSVIVAYSVTLVPTIENIEKEK